MAGEAAGLVSVIVRWSALIAAWTAVNSVKLVTGGSFLTSPLTRLHSASPAVNPAIVTGTALTLLMVSGPF